MQCRQQLNPYPQGAFYYRFINGESGADVYERIASFMDYLHRSFRRSRWPSAGAAHLAACAQQGYHVFPRNVVIVTHVCPRSAGLLGRFIPPALPSAPRA